MATGAAWNGGSVTLSRCAFCGWSSFYFVWGWLHCGPRCGIRSVCSRMPFFDDLSSKWMDEHSEDIFLVITDIHYDPYYQELVGVKSKCQKLPDYIKFPEKSPKSTSSGTSPGAAPPTTPDKSSKISQNSEASEPGPTNPLNVGVLGNSKPKLQSSVQLPGGESPKHAPIKLMSLSESPPVPQDDKSKTESGPPPKVESGPPPKAESAPPKVESGTPNAESAPPKVESGTPKVESASPKTESDPPKAESGQPKTESGPPKAESGPPEEGPSKSASTEPHSGKSESVINAGESHNGESESKGVPDSKGTSESSGAPESNGAPGSKDSKGESVNEAAPKDSPDSKVASDPKDASQSKDSLDSKGVPESSNAAESKTDSTSSEAKKHESLAPARFGRQGCDSPMSLVRAVFDQTKLVTPRPKFALVAGDLFAHVRGDSKMIEHIEAVF
eukprot:219837_1